MSIKIITISLLLLVSHNEVFNYFLQTILLTTPT